MKLKGWERGFKIWIKKKNEWDLRKVIKIKDWKISIKEDDGKELEGDYYEGKVNEKRY